MKVTVAIFLVYTICISSEKDQRDIFVSQKPGSINEVGCGVAQVPCLTVPYAAKLCQSQDCYLSIDGGTQNKPFMYYINDKETVNFSGVDITMAASDSNFRPIIVNNKSEQFSNDSFVNIDAGSLSIESIIFIGKEGSYASITILIPIAQSGPLQIQYCSFSNNELIIQGDHSSITQSEFKNSYIIFETTAHHNLIKVNFSKSFLHLRGYNELIDCNFTDSVLYANEIALLRLTEIRFNGSFQNGTTSVLPQVYLEKPIARFELHSSVLSNALNGAIQAEHTNSFLLKDSEIHDNKREQMSLKSVVHFTNGVGSIINCAFVNNISPLFEGGTLFYEGTDSQYDNHLKLAYVRVSHKYNQYSTSPVKLSCTSNPIDFSSLDVFLCPPNTCIQKIFNEIFFQYFCFDCRDEKYSFGQSYLTAYKGSVDGTYIVDINNAPRTSCPLHAKCLVEGVLSKGNYWATTDWKGKLHFFKCPSYYCCDSEESCVSYNTCNNNRSGRLCGDCLNGHVLSIFSHKSCMNEDDCKILPFWVVFIFVAIVVFISFVYIEKGFTVFSYLEKPIKTARNRRRRNPLRSVVSVEQMDVDNQAEESCHDGSEQNLLTSLPPEKPCTVNGMIKILFCFYQTVAIIQIQKSHPSIAFVFTELIVSFFTMKIEIPSLNLNVCTMMSDNAVVLETIKTSVLLLCLSFCVLTFLCWFVKYILNHFCFNQNREDEPLIRRFHEMIDKTTNSYIVLPITVRIKLAYMQFLLLGYTAITMLLLKSVHCIQIMDEFYLFIQSSKQCFQSGEQFIAMALIISWSLIFPISIFVGVRLLRECKITPNSFLLLLSFPPAIIWYLVKPKLVQVEGRLGHTQAMLAYHMIEVLNQPFKTNFKTENNAGVKEYQLNFEPVLIFRRLILLLISVFVLSSMTRLFLIELALGIFLFHNLIILPYKTERLNAMDVICKISLMLLSIVNFMLNEGFTNTNLAVFLGVFLTLAPIFAFFIFVVMNYEEKHSIFKRFILRKVD